MAKKKSSDISKIVSVIAIIIAAVVWLFETFGPDSKNETKQAAVDENVTTQVHFVDVGQGDATLIVSDGEAMLIDTGEIDTDYKLLNYLKDHDITSLKYLVITHSHTDHMGAAANIIPEISTDKIIMPKVSSDMTPTNSTYKYFLKTVKKLNMKITTAKDETFDLGNAKIQLFTTKQEHKSLNNYSILVKVVDGENSFLITGDCETEEENEMLEQGLDLSATVLRAGHHGSKTSSSQKFIDAVDPSYVVISCGKDNDYGHPHDVTVKRLKAQTDNYYVTADNGSIVFSSDGKGLTVETEK